MRPLWLFLNTVLLRKKKCPLDGYYISSLKNCAVLVLEKWKTNHLGLKCHSFARPQLGTHYTKEFVFCIRSISVEKVRMAFFQSQDEGRCYCHKEWRKSIRSLHRLTKTKQSHQPKGNGRNARQLKRKKAKKCVSHNTKFDLIWHLIVHIFCLFCSVMLLLFTVCENLSKVSLYIKQWE